MVASTKSFILVSCLYVLVQCEIPNLSVRKVDKSLIAKKRQDTLDMCRLFTEESAKIEHTKPKIISSYKSYSNVRQSHNRRHKREVATTNAVNPALKAEDAIRVERIVEKLYDDLMEKGQNITYRQNTIPTSTTPSTSTTKLQKPKKKAITSGRKFFFAPELLLGPPPESESLSSPPNDTALYIKARWTQGIVPYFIDSKTYDAQLQDTIIKAFDYIEKATCIRLQKLRERPTDKRSLQEVDWVYITNPSGIRQCVHSNEKRKIDGVQMSVLGYDCMSLGDIVHEVMHILGFSHEHTRSDRDQHISILWDNIKPGYKKYFEIVKAVDQYNLENLPYDFASVLHYPPRAFSKNGQVTILAESGIKIGQRDGLSDIDVEKVGAIYASECVERNRQYLLKTCPSVVKTETQAEDVSQQDIENYFKDRIWPFGLVNYKLRDNVEFSTEEKENIQAVIRHIEQETCIQFRDVSVDDDDKEKPNSSPEDVAEDNPDPKSPNNAEDVGDDNSDGKLGDSVTIKAVIADTNEVLADDTSVKNISENEIKTLDEKKDDAQLLNDPQEELRSNDIKKSKANVAAEKSASRPAAMHSRKNMKSRRKASRRHANSVMVLTRSALPGCKCPPPGQPGKNTVLEINADCFNSVNDLLHLFVHVLGLDHQHNMHDRDSYLHIVWDNLTTDIKNELQNKLPPAAAVGFPYDYQSVMHYPWLQIKDGVTNMMYPIWNDGWAMGHWQGLSSFDVQKLNLLYFSQCSERQKQAGDSQLI